MARRIGTKAARRSNDEAAGRWHEVIPSHAGNAQRKGTRQREISRERRWWRNSKAGDKPA